MHARQAKDDLYDAFASVAKALGSGRRAEIIDLLAQGERSVEEIATEIDQSMANTSHHLRSLATAGLLRSRRDGQRIIYRLTSDRVADLWAACAMSRPPTSTTSTSSPTPTSVPEISSRSSPPIELAERLERGRAVVIDVRPTLEYAAGHIPGARSVPIDQLGDAIDTLPRSREIVAYCRGPYCVYADDAVRLLRSKGFKARRLDTGYPEWHRAGLPIEPDPRQRSA